MNRNLFFAIIAFGLNACATNTPPKPEEYSRPIAIIPPNLGNIPSEAGQNTNLNWQSLFIDKNLQNAISLSLANNRNLRIAANNIERAAAQSALINAGRFPSIAGNSSIGVSQSASASGNNNASESYAVNFGLSNFEIDMYGRLKQSAIAAQENYFSQKQNATALKISIISQTALGWLSIISDQDALLNAQKTKAAWLHTYTLVKARKARGLSSDLDETAISIQLRQTDADILAIETRRNQNKALLFAIIGEKLNDENYASSLINQSLIGAVPTNLSSAILFNRPDIIAAEHNLLASQANIRAARAAFFPRISITSGFGLATREFGNLFSSGAFAYNLAGSLSAPIFDNGANKANFDIATANQKAAINQYENAIIAAFSENWAAFSVRAQINERIEAQEAIIKDAQKVAGLVEARFNAGLDSYLPLLAARRTLYNAEQNLINLQYLKAANSVAIYRYLGSDNSIISQ